MILKFALLLLYTAVITECQFSFGGPIIFAGPIYSSQSSFEKISRKPLKPTSSGIFYSQKQQEGSNINKYNSQQSFAQRGTDGFPNAERQEEQINVQSLNNSPKPGTSSSNGFNPSKNQYQSNKNDDQNQQFGNNEENPQYTSLGTRPNYRGQDQSYPGGQFSYQSESQQYQPEQVLGSNRKTVSKNPYSQSNKEDKFEDYKPITEFSWSLFKKINNPQQPNYVICPLSPQHLLSYLASGAEGETKNEIVRAIKYNSPNQLNSLVTTMLREPGNKELQLASALFVSDRISINRNFEGNLSENTKIFLTDFSNTEKFNREYSKWVAENTKGTLTKSRIQPEPSTRMLMSSAVYFKGEWIFKLNPGGNEDFYVNEITPVKVPMMKLLKKLPYGKLQNGNLGEWIALPYNSNDSMVIIMPPKGLPIDSMIERLNVQEVFDAMNIDNYANVTLTLPKFKVESRSSLINPLQQMGVRQLFSSNAQLPNLFRSSEPLSISSVLQQASLEVNEEGSIASSLTAFAVVALSFSPPTPDVEFKVDRPFVAMIIDRKNNFPYFIAKISNPAV